MDGTNSYVRALCSLLILEDVIRKLESKLFERVTGLTIDDFDLLLRVGVFNRAH